MVTLAFLFLTLGLFPTAPDARAQTPANPPGATDAEAQRTEMASHREAIDALDARIVELLNERARHAQAIGAIKQRRGAEAYAPTREQAVLERISALNKGPLPPASLRAVYREIMSASLALERPPTVAYLGPAATFTHQAARARFGASVHYAPQTTLADVIQSVAAGRSDYGVVPFENSTEGGVTTTLDALVSSDSKALAEVRLPISHVLASRAGSPARIQRLYVHPQTRGQCRTWIAREFPRAEIIETTSNARSAELAARDRRAGALSGAFTASTYGLPILSRNIQDDARNTTRFLVLGKSSPPPGPNDRTTFWIEIPSGSSALETTLATLRTHGLASESIHARPLRGSPGGQALFLTVPGHAARAPLDTVLAELRRAGVGLHIVGSYPVAELSSE